MALQSVPVPPPEHGEDVQKLLTADALSPASPCHCTLRLQYVVVGVRASEQPTDGSAAAFPWPWTACMVWPVMEPGDGTCSTYACVCLRAAWNCACGTSAVVHACTHGYIQYVCSAHACMAARSMHGAWFASCMYVRTYTSPFTCPCPCPIRRRRAGLRRAAGPPRLTSRIRVPASSLASSHDSRVVPEGGGTHAGHLHATVRVRIYAWPYVVPRAVKASACAAGTTRCATTVQGRWLLQLAHSTLRSIWPCVHVGASIIHVRNYGRHTRLPPYIWHGRPSASARACAHVLYIELRLPFVPRRVFFFSFLCGLESAHCLRHQIWAYGTTARDIHVLYSEHFLGVARSPCLYYTRPSPNDRLFFFLDTVNLRTDQ